MEWFHGIEASLLQWMQFIGLLIESFGVLVITIGCIMATYRFLKSYKNQFQTAYRQYRLHLAYSILLGLELLVAGDIIRTVVVDNSLQEVLVLALIVLIRTFLSMTLELETEGRWPWQRDTKPQNANSSS